MTASFTKKVFNGNVWFLYSGFYAKRLNNMDS